MANFFNEPKAILESITREFTAVGSLNTATAFSATVACEGTVVALVKSTTGKDFPYQRYTRHKPGNWLTLLGISSYYSSKTQQLLNKIDGYSLDKARYETTPAFIQYTNPSAEDRSRILVEVVTRFIDESERLAKTPEVVAQLKEASKTWK